MGRLSPHLQGAHCLAMERQRPLKRPWRASGGDLSERLGLGRSEGLGSWPATGEGGPGVAGRIAVQRDASRSADRLSFLPSRG